MGQIKVTQCSIKGLYIIETPVFSDSRGNFTETYNRQTFTAAGLDMTFVQDNQSLSRCGVLRGLHYQKNYPQGKLVRVVKGSVFDVAVDIRLHSDTFGQWFGIELSEQNKKQLYIPGGFAHGYMVLDDEAEFCYKCTDYYHPNDEGGIAWNDPDINICWPGLSGSYPGNAGADGYIIHDRKLIIAEKDMKWPRLKDCDFVFDRQRE